MIRVGKAVVKVPGEGHHAHALRKECLQVFDAVFADAALLYREKAGNQALFLILQDFLRRCHLGDLLLIGLHQVLKDGDKVLYACPGIAVGRGSCHRLSRAVKAGRAVEVYIERQVLAQASAAAELVQINHQVVLPKGDRVLPESAVPDLRDRITVHVNVGYLHRGLPF